jgi:hypothetical protein
VFDTATGNFYDPSYGSGPHANWNAWMNAGVAGLRDPTLALAGLAVGALPPPAAPNIVKLLDLTGAAFLN